MALPLLWRAPELVPQRLSLPLPRWLDDGAAMETWRPSPSVRSHAAQQARVCASASRGSLQGTSQNRHASGQRPRKT
eukprot:1043132-Prymnesium_polylepis.1